MKEDQYNILFVCSGNSCRSPMAEGLLKAKLPSDLVEKVVVQSAGTLGIEGARATAFAVEAVRELDADISGHFSQGVTGELLQKADLIFALARNHRDFLLDYFPAVSDKVFLLRTFDRDRSEPIDEDIDDPVGASRTVYQQCAELLNSELQRIMPRLLALIRAKL